MKSLDCPCANYWTILVEIFTSPVEFMEWANIHRSCVPIPSFLSCRMPSRSFFGILLTLSSYCFAVYALWGEGPMKGRFSLHFSVENALHINICCALSLTRLTPLCLGFWKRVLNCHMWRDISVLIFISMRLKVKHVTTKLVYVIPLSKSAVMPKIRYLIGLWEKQMQKDAIPTI